MRTQTNENQGCDSGDIEEDDGIVSAMYFCGLDYGSKPLIQTGIGFRSKVENRTASESSHGQTGYVLVLESINCIDGKRNYEDTEELRYSDDVAMKRNRLSTSSKQFGKAVFFPLGGLP